MRRADPGIRRLARYLLRLENEHRHQLALMIAVRWYCGR